MKVQTLNTTRTFIFPEVWEQTSFLITTSNTRNFSIDGQLALHIFQILFSNPNGEAKDLEQK